MAAKTSAFRSGQSVEDTNAEESAVTADATRTMGAPSMRKPYRGRGGEKSEQSARELQHSIDPLDTLTHGLAGGLLGRAVGRRGAAVAVVAVASAGAMFPDLDAFFLPGSWFSLRDTMNYLRYHRGVTHSFVMAPLFALAIALIARLFARRTGIPLLWAAALLGIVSHILFDWITSYGTMFFSPISWRRYSLDWVFILDPYFSGIPLLALVVAFFVPAQGRRIGMAGSVALVAYIGICAAFHAEAIASAKKLFRGARVSALPQPFSPRRWALFADRGDSIDVAYVRIGSPPAGVVALVRPQPKSRLGRMIALLRDAYVPPQSAAIESFPTEERNPSVIAARASPDVGVWHDFARFPVAQVERSADGGARVTFTDLRFRGPWGRPAFQYEVLLDPSGKERAAGFVRLFVIQETTRRR